MTRIFGGMLPEAAWDLFPVQFGAPPIQAYALTEFLDPIQHIDDEHEWDNSWIDLGGES